MSKYMVNKLMRAVEMSNAAVAAYKDDATGFVDSWVGGSVSAAHRPDDHVLTDAEYDAFSRRDYAALYGLGANPYMLWHFTEAVFVPDIPWHELKEQYREAIRPYGEPDVIV